MYVKLKVSMQAAFERLPLYGKYSNGKFAIIDTGTGLSRYRWYVSNIGYIYRRNYAVKNGHIYLHHEVLSAPKGMWRDHINGDKFDNRRCNLRLITPKESACNRGSRLAKSGYRGVRRKGDRFIAQITDHGKNVYLGCYKTSVEAARAYNESASRIHGSFARLNAIWRLFWTLACARLEASIIEHQTINTVGL